MADSHPPTPENQDEITAFITEGMHRLATIYTNDYGFLLSARMAQTYLQRAMHLLETKHSVNNAMRHEINALKTIAGAIAHDYAEFETFCTDCERFNHLKTKSYVEWLSKWAVRAISSSYLGTAGHLLAHKIRTFHTRLCSVLTEE